MCFVGDASSIHLQEWTKRFAAFGHEILVLSNRPAVTANAAFRLIPVSPTKSRYINALYRIFWIRRALGRLKPDVVNVHYVNTDTLGVIWAKTGKVALSFWGSDVFVDPRGSKAKDLILRYLIRHADLLHSVARHMTERLTLLGAPEERTVTLQYGVDMGSFKPSKKEHSGRPTIISTRHLEGIYGLDAFLRAIPEVLARMKVDVRFLGEGRLRGYLERLAHDLDISEAVEFKGHVPHDQMPAYLNSADIYVSLSRSEGASLSLLEAMACGVFPIVSDIPQNREWIVPGENGFLVPVEAHARLAAKIIEALENDSLRRKAAKYNRKVIEERGNADKNFKILEQVFQKIAAK